MPVYTTKSSFRAGLQIPVHCVAGTGRRSPLFRFLCLLNIRLNLVPLSPIRQQWISCRSRLVHLPPIRQQCINITALARFTPFRWIDQKRVNLTLRQGACIYNKILCSCRSPDRAHTLDRRSPLFRFLCLLNIRLNLVPLSPIRQQCISITALARFTTFRWIDQKRVNLTLRQGACIYNKIFFSCWPPDTRPLRGGHMPGPVYAFSVD